MSDLISRQAAIDAIYAEFEYVYCFNCDHEGNEEWCEDCHRKYMKWSASRNTIERVLNGLPSAQPEPKHGSWKTTYLDHEAMGVRPRIYYCSVCCQCIAYPTNFCPNCGADMREEEQDD